MNRFPLKVLLSSDGHQNHDVQKVIEVEIFFAVTSRQKGIVFLFKILFVVSQLLKQTVNMPKANFENR